MNFSERIKKATKKRTKVAQETLEQQEWDNHLFENFKSFLSQNVLGQKFQHVEGGRKWIIVEKWKGLYFSPIDKQGTYSKIDESAPHILLVEFIDGRGMWRASIRNIGDLYNFKDGTTKIWFNNVNDPCLKEVKQKIEDTVIDFILN